LWLIKKPLKEHDCTSQWNQACFSYNLSTVATISVWTMWLESWIVVLRFYLLLYQSVKPKFADHCSSQQRAIIVILQWTGMPFFSLRMPSMWTELTFKGPLESWPVDSSHWMSTQATSNEYLCVTSVSKFCLLLSTVPNASTVIIFAAQP
jgi:hypothetical protein